MPESGTDAKLKSRFVTFHFYVIFWHRFEKQREIKYKILQYDNERDDIVSERESDYSGSERGMTFVLHEFR